jgi:peptidyl-Lys metalloendopeptidase
MRYLSICFLVFWVLALICSSATAEEPKCIGSNLSTAQSAMRNAERGLDTAIAALNNPSNSDLDKAAIWLGVHSSSDASEARDKLIRTRVYTTGAVFLCAVSTTIKLGDVYAYVRPDNAFAIVLGYFFFQAPSDGFNSQFGVLIHEMSHFVLAGATKDIVYGLNGARNLASTNPSAARKNADNYEYFVEALVAGR